MRYIYIYIYIYIPHSVTSVTVVHDDTDASI